MKGEGAEFPKKPCVQIHTKSLCAAVSNAKSRRAQGYPLEDHSQVGKRKAEMLERAFQALGRLQPHSSDRVSLCKRSSKKITPSVPAQVPVLENHYFSITYKEHPHIHLFFTLRKNLELLFATKAPKASAEPAGSSEQHLSPGVAGHSLLPPATTLPILSPASSWGSPGFHSFGLGWSSFLRFAFLLTRAELLLVCGGLLRMGSVS